MKTALEIAAIAFGVFLALPIIVAVVSFAVMLLIGVPWAAFRAVREWICEQREGERVAFVRAKRVAFVKMFIESDGDAASAITAIEPSRYPWRRGWRWMKQFGRDFASELIYGSAAFLFVAVAVWLLRNQGLAWYEWPIQIAMFAFTVFILYAVCLACLAVLAVAGGLASAILGDRGGNGR